MPFTPLLESKPVEVELNQDEVLELAKTKRIATLAEVHEYVNEHGRWFYTSTWLEYDGEEATAWNLHEPEKKIKFKLSKENGEKDLSALGVKEKIFVWRNKKWAGLLLRGGGVGQYVVAGWRPSGRHGVLVKED